MRAVAICLGAVLLTSCSAAVDVAAEDRVQLDSPAITDDAPALSVTPASLLLGPDDLPEWNVRPPSSVGTVDYAASDCSFLDTVRSIDSRLAIGTTGASSSVGFYNNLIDMRSETAATSFMDEADALPTSCPSFNDPLPGWTQPLDVNSGGWRGVGVVIGTTRNVVYLGYWQRGSTIVKLRVVGQSAPDQFQMLANEVADNLSAGPSQPEDRPSTIPTPTIPTPTIPTPTNPTTTTTTGPGEPAWSEDNEWRTSPLAALVLDPDDIGPDWELAVVEAAEPYPGGATWACGITKPPTMPGVQAEFRPLGGSRATLWQMIGEGDSAAAQAWVDTVRKLSSCTENLDSTTAENTEVSIIDLSRYEIPGAVDATLATVAYDWEGEQFLTVYAVARFSGVLVMLSLTSMLAYPPLDDIPTPNEMVRLLSLAAPD